MNFAFKVVFSFDTFARWWNYIQKLFDILIRSIFCNTRVLDVILWALQYLCSIIWGCWSGASFCITNNEWTCTIPYYDGSGYSLAGNTAIQEIYWTMYFNITGSTGHFLHLYVSIRKRKKIWTQQITIDFNENHRLLPDKCLHSHWARGSSLDSDSVGLDVARGKMMMWLCYLQQMAKMSRNRPWNPARTLDTP